MCKSVRQELRKDEKALWKPKDKSVSQEWRSCVDYLCISSKNMPASKWVAYAWSRALTFAEAENPWRQCPYPVQEKTTLWLVQQWRWWLGRRERVELRRYASVCVVHCNRMDCGLKRSNDRLCQIHTQDQCRKHDTRFFFLRRPWLPFCFHKDGVTIFSSVIIYLCCSYGEVLLCCIALDCHWPVHQEISKRNFSLVCVWGKSANMMVYCHMHTSFSAREKERERERERDERDWDRRRERERERERWEGLRWRERERERERERQREREKMGDLLIHFCSRQWGGISFIQTPPGDPRRKKRKKEEKAKAQKQEEEGEAEKETKGVSRHRSVFTCYMFYLWKFWDDHFQCEDSCRAQKHVSFVGCESACHQ